MFDVTTEPWIPVTDRAGKVREVGLRELFLTAHELTGMRDPMPTVEFGVYRLLTAIALDMLFEQPGVELNLAELENVLDRGRFEKGRVSEYFDALEGSFDLFSADRPFLQTVFSAGEKPKPVAAMVHAAPSGTNADHFHHGRETDFAIAPAMAARLLATLAPFTTEGGRGLSPSVNGLPPWYELVLGDTLFETICLNVLALPNGTVEGSEPVAWRNRAKPGGEKRNRTSYASALTWRPRRVQLVPGPGGRCAVTGRESPVLVREMRFAPGDSWDASRRWSDPNVAYRTTKNGTSSVKPVEGRDLYRDLGPLALLRQTQHSGSGEVSFDRPRVVDQYEKLVEEGVIPATRELRLAVYGIRVAQKSKVFEWQREELPPLSYEAVHDERVQALAQAAMERAEDGSQAVRVAIQRLATDRKDAKPLWGLVLHAHRRYWAVLYQPYVGYVRAAGEAFAGNRTDEIAGLTGDFLARVRREAMDAFDEAAEPFEATGKGLERLAMARSALSRRLLFQEGRPASGKTTPVTEKEERTSDD